MALGDRPAGRVLKYGLHRPSRPAPQEWIEAPPGLLEQLGVEAEPAEPEPEELQDEDFAKSLRADVDAWREQPRPEPFELPKLRQRRWKGYWGSQR